MSPETLVQTQNHLISALRTVRSKITMLMMKHETLRWSLDRCSAQVQSQVQVQSQPQTKGKAQAEVPMQAKEQKQQQQVQQRNYIAAEVRKVGLQLQSLCMDEHCLLKEVEVCNVRIQQTIDEILVAGGMGGDGNGNGGLYHHLHQQKQKQNQQQQQGAWLNVGQQLQSYGQYQRVHQYSPRGYGCGLGVMLAPAVHQYNGRYQKGQYTAPTYGAYGNVAPSLALSPGMQPGQIIGGAGAVPHGGLGSRYGHGVVFTGSGHDGQLTGRLCHLWPRDNRPQNCQNQSNSHTQQGELRKSKKASSKVKLRNPCDLDEDAAYEKALSQMKETRKGNAPVAPSNSVQDTSMPAPMAAGDRTRRASSCYDRNGHADSSGRVTESNTSYSASDSTYNANDGSRNNSSDCFSEEPSFTFDLKVEPFGARSAREGDERGQRLGRRLRRSDGGDESAEKAVRGGDYFGIERCGDDGGISPRTVGTNVCWPGGMDSVVS